MPSLPVLEDLPDGYTVEEGSRGVLALHSDVAELLHGTGYGPESDGEFRESELAGRHPLRELEAGQERLLLRRFTHGGLMRWITRRRFLDAERPFRELILSDSLLRTGISTPRVVAARARSTGFGWELEVVTRRIENTIDLGFVLGLARRGKLAPRARRRVLIAFGELVGKLHRLGCLHADLQPNNVLVDRATLDGAPVRLWILDLDRSTLGPALTDVERRANLERLFRHVARREADHGSALRRSDFMRFFRGYDLDRRLWKEDWRAVASLHERGMTWHRVGWWLERAFSSRSDDPRASGRG